MSNDQPRDRFPFDCIPRGMDRPQLKAWLQADDENGKRVVAEIKTILAGTARADHPVTHEQATKALPNWQHLATFSRIMRLKNIRREYERRENKLEAGNLRRIVQLNNEIVDEILSMPEPNRSEMLAVELPYRAFIQSYASDPELAETVLGSNVHNLLTTATHDYDAGNRSPGHIAHLLTLIDDTLEATARLTTPPAGLLPALYSLREKLLHPAPDTTDEHDD